MKLENLTKQKIEEIALQEYPLKIQEGLVLVGSMAGPIKKEFDMNKNQREIFIKGMEKVVELISVKV